MTNATRQIALDTETTGLSPSQGHRIVEIGCVEILDRKLTGQHFHCYLNPQRKVDDEAIKVHGLTERFLADKPLFSKIVHNFMSFVSGAELIIHNATFDVRFLDHELTLAQCNISQIESCCTVTDTLRLAKHKHPDQKNTLDALCERYNVNNTRREFHGALLDAEILAELYLTMTSDSQSAG
ncbi:MAG: DNA polymerase III subunit epsilon [Gammaproteobacteria bacterium]|nr:DNA polymerase III subunit epsilon [Gammaproteobacteria bacterium]MCY4358456.1 DNA polymerase III subunit epsilon [Gammaproteobacteria bacterium]